MDQRARRSMSFRQPVVFSGPQFNWGMKLTATRVWEALSTSTVTSWLT